MLWGFDHSSVQSVCRFCKKWHEKRVKNWSIQNSAVAAVPIGTWQNLVSLFGWNEVLCWRKWRQNHIAMNYVTTELLGYAAWRQNSPFKDWPRNEILGLPSFSSCICFNQKSTALSSISWKNRYVFLFYMITCLVLFVYFTQKPSLIWTASKSDWNPFLRVNHTIFT